MIQTASGQQIIVQNVGQAGGVQIAGGETLQQIQVIDRDIAADTGSR